MHTLSSLRQGYKAVIIGAGGGIGSALADRIEADHACGRLVRLSRRSVPPVDLYNEATIAAAANHLRAELGTFDLIVNAAGGLVIDDAPPEKAIKHIDADNMARHFALNAIGPALLVKHFAPLLPKSTRGLFASLSARVGSISDNRLGGWFAYRAAKAAQNQIIKTAAIEMARTHPEAVLVALHPGTVATRLSEPFAAHRERLAPEESARMLLSVLDGLTPAQSGGFFDYRGEAIGW